MIWARPLASCIRSGFEVTGYVMSRRNVKGISSSASFAKPHVTVQRSGFEITGYAMVKS